MTIYGLISMHVNLPKTRMSGHESSVKTAPGMHFSLIPRLRKGARRTKVCSAFFYMAVFELSCPHSVWKLCTPPVVGPLVQMGV